LDDVEKAVFQRVFWQCENVTCQVQKPTFQGELVSVSSFPTFWPLENTTSSDRETHISRRHRFVWAHFLNFLACKIVFCRVVKPTVQRVIGSCVHISYILEICKRDLCRTVKRIIVGDLRFLWSHFLHFAALKRDFHWFVKTTNKGELASFEFICCNLWPLNSTFADS
jgi:hypothetical protein